jgi:hypothetical protein
MSKESGRLAWLLWRSAYFTMTLSVRNKYVQGYFMVQDYLTHTVIEFWFQCTGKQPMSIFT